MLVDARRLPALGGRARIGGIGGIGTIGPHKQFYSGYIASSACLIDGSINALKVISRLIEYLLNEFEMICKDLFC